MAEVSIDDVSIEVEEAGDGEALVLVHGSASDRRTWDAQRALLSDHYKVVTYSRRYHWPNPPAADDATYSMGQQVEDLVRIIETIDRSPVHVVGHSYGGFVALLAAVRHPELVRDLVLIEPPVVPLFLSDPPKPAEVVRVLMKKPRLGIALLKFGAGGLVPARKAATKNDMTKAIQIFGKAVLGTSAFSRLSADRWEQVVANNIRAEYLSEIFDPLTPEDVRSVVVPTLLVSGEDSPRLWSLLSDELHDLLPDSTRVAIPKASHIVQEDNPEAVAREIRSFIEAN